LTPLDGSADSAKKIARELFDAGVIAFIAGANPTRIRFLPPVGAVTDRDIDLAVEVLEGVLLQHA
jgi:acetylornithine aminotransferase